MMNESLLRKAAALPQRQLHLLGAGLLLVSAAALWFYGLRAPLAALRTVRAEAAQLAVAGGPPQLNSQLNSQLNAQLAALATDTEALAGRLGPAMPATQQLMDLIGEAGALARQHGVALHGAQPAPETAVLAFRQVGFDADVSGSYGALLAWLAAVEHARPGLAIEGFDMRASKMPGQVDMKLRVVAYRAQEDGR
ncbi:hypothetical protein IM543_01000 [Massilia sp. UMI-21]|nr:hypothetical protein IM543_01000 [Massilia sp. UMI-21]